MTAIYYRVSFVMPVLVQSHDLAVAWLKYWPHTHYLSLFICQSVIMASRNVKLPIVIGYHP